MNKQQSKVIAIMLAIAILLAAIAVLIDRQKRRA